MNWTDALLREIELALRRRQTVINASLPPVLARVAVLAEEVVAA